MKRREGMIIKQLEIGYMANFSYIVGCEKTRKAMVIDPAADVERILSTAEKESLTIEIIVNTHGHGDHTAGNTALKAHTGAEIMIHMLDDERCPGADFLIVDEEIWQIGEITFDIFHTPGHTPGGMCLYAQGNLFTGDTLFVGDSGRTDLPGGDRPTLAKSIRRLMKLPDDTVIWPGHNYGPTPTSTIHWEKRNNVNAVEYGYFEKD
jgi:glyoxylase-like metal-dependent hydrolase (beta-lactamase superfamily II)